MPESFNMTAGELSALVEVQEQQQAAMAKMSEELTLAKRACKLASSQLKACKGDKLHIRQKYDNVKKEARLLAEKNAELEAQLEGDRSERLVEVHEGDQARKQVAVLESELLELRQISMELNSTLEKERASHKAEINGLRSALRVSGKVGKGLDTQLEEYIMYIEKLEHEKQELRTELDSTREEAEKWERLQRIEAKEHVKTQRHLATLALTSDKLPNAGLPVGKRKPKKDQSSELKKGGSNRFDVFGQPARMSAVEKAKLERRSLFPPEEKRRSEKLLPEPHTSDKQIAPQHN